MHPEKEAAKSTGKHIRNPNFLSQRGTFGNKGNLDAITVLHKSIQNGINEKRKKTAGPLLAPELSLNMVKPF
jgi:hypothetical protein